MDWTPQRIVVELHFTTIRCDTIELVPQAFRDADILRGGSGLHVFVVSIEPSVAGARDKTEYDSAGYAVLRGEREQLRK